eukprot:m51a1_g13943 hypothetical protein (307) ;mRNA; r:884622-885689
MADDCPLLDAAAAPEVTKEIAGTTFSESESHDDLVPAHTIWTCRWLPAGRPPRAALVVVHGVHEHCLRYSNLVKAMAAEGIAVFSYDHPGHGRSSGMRGYFESMDLLVAGAQRYTRRVHGEFASVPVFLFGHSMGAAVATQASKGLNDVLSGLLLSGVPTEFDVVPWLLQTPAMWLVRLVSWLAPTLRLIALDERSLCGNQAVVEAVHADPYCVNDRLCMRVVAEVALTGARVAAGGPDMKLPLVMLHGKRDGICSPSGSRKLFESAASLDKTFYSIDSAYHEVLNESKGPEYARLLSQWVAARIK